MKKYLLAAAAPIAALLTGNAVAQEAVKPAKPEVAEQKFEFGKADKPNPATDAIQKSAGNGGGKVNVGDLSAAQRPASAHEKLGNGIKGESSAVETTDTGAPDKDVWLVKEPDTQAGDQVEKVPAASHLKLGNGIKGEVQD